MASNLKQLLAKLSTSEKKPVTDSATSTKSVTFVESAIDDPRPSTRHGRAYTSSPRSTSTTGDDRRTERSPQQYNTADNSSRRASYNGRPPLQTRSTAEFQQTRRPAPFTGGQSPPEFSYNPAYRSQTSYRETSQQRLTGNCRFCGYLHQFGRAFCPVAKLACRKCKKIGHMARCCQSRPSMPQYSRQPTGFANQYYTH
jgi:hypothetical protein